MIINLFTRTFLTSPTIRCFNKDFIKYIRLEDLRIDRTLPPYEYFSQLLDKIDFDSSYIFLIPGGIKQYYRVLAKYCSLLQIYDDEMLSSLFTWFEDYLNDWSFRMHEFPASYSIIPPYGNSEVSEYMLVSRLKDYMYHIPPYEFDKNDERFLNAIPAEYYINEDDSNYYKKKKFNSFWVYEIMELMFKYSLACFNADLPLPKEYMEIQKKAIGENVELKDYIIGKYSGKDAIKFRQWVYNFIHENPIRGKVMDDRGILDIKTIDEYINNQKSTRGYTSINLFKYNRHLEEAIRNTRYLLPIKNE